MATSNQQQQNLNAQAGQGGANPGADEQDQAEVKLSPEEQKERDQMLKDAMGDGPAANGAGGMSAIVLAQNEQLYKSPEWLKFQLDTKVAKIYAFSGLFGTNNLSIQQSLAQTYVKIQLGRDMGFSDSQSMQGISVVQNRPYVEYPLLGARLTELGYTWHTIWHKQNRTITGVTLLLFKDGKAVMQPRYDADGQIIYKKNAAGTGPELDADGNPVPEMQQVSESFTREDAAEIKFKVKGQSQSLSERDTYKNFPKNMYYAKALRNIQRFHVPNAFKNNVPIGRDEAEEIELFRQSDAQGGAYSAEISDAARESAGDELRDLQQQQQQSTGKVVDDPNGEGFTIELPTESAETPKEPATLFNEQAAPQQQKSTAPPATKRGFGEFPTRNK